MEQNCKLTTLLTWRLNLRKLMTTICQVDQLVTRVLITQDLTYALTRVLIKEFTWPIWTTFTKQPIFVGFFFRSTCLKLIYKSCLNNCLYLSICLLFVISLLARWVLYILLQPIYYSFNFFDRSNFFLNR